MKPIVIDIVSGFLGAGKTTLIKKLLKDGLENEKVVLIENEFGEVNIDSYFLEDTGIAVRELTAGCICCSLTTEFASALNTIVETFQPDRILIEPTGVAKTKDMLKAIAAANLDCLQMGSITTVVCGETCLDYIEGYGEFFEDQIAKAGCVLVNQLDTLIPAEARETLRSIRRINPFAPVVTTPWEQLAGTEILSAIGGELPIHHWMQEKACSCGRRNCGHHDHAPSPFQSVALETNTLFDPRVLEETLPKLSSGEFGKVLRAKGVVPALDGWLHFDYTPATVQVREGNATVTGMVCVIGEHLDEQALAELFHGVPIAKA